MDWLFGAAACAVLGAIAAGALLWASDLDRRDPSTLSLYLAIGIICVFPPLWLLYTALGWTWFGATAGMAIAHVRVVSEGGSHPGVWRSGARAALLLALTTPAVFVPLLVGLAFSLGSIGPPILFLPVGGAMIISVAACASPLLVPTRRAWHDRLSGTSVVSAKTPFAAAPPR